MFVCALEPNEKAPMNSYRGLLFKLVPRVGLEPTQLAPPTPEAGVSTNFTTWAALLAPSTRRRLLRPRTINSDSRLVNAQTDYICGFVIMTAL